MKLLLALVGFLVLTIFSLPFLVAAVIATHPWMVVGMLTGPVQVIDPALPAPPLDADSDVVRIAQRWVGVPYLFGGCTTGGIDCSCLVQRVYQAVGRSLPRTAAEQYAATARLNRDQLEPGDLVFFANTYMPGISHVGIYVGGGQQINAPAEGLLVSIQPVFEGYWGAHYLGAGRVRR